jgi:hypothetical protein
VKSHQTKLFGSKPEPPKVSESAQTQKRGKTPDAVGILNTWPGVADYSFVSNVAPRTESVTDTV